MKKPLKYLICTVLVTSTSVTSVAAVDDEHAGTVEEDQQLEQLGTHEGKAGDTYNPSKAETVAKADAAEKCKKRNFAPNEDGTIEFNCEFIDPNDDEDWDSETENGVVTTTYTGICECDVFTPSN